LKTILIAHRSAAVRERFAAAVTDARHAFVSSASEADTLAAAASADASAPHLALVDFGMVEDGVAFVQALRDRAGERLAVMVFAGSVPSAAAVPALAAMKVGYVNEHAAAAHILPALAPYLFPDNFNRRAGARVRIGLPVTYRVGQTVAGATTLDVGKSGVSVRTMTPLATGTPLQIKFRLPAATNDVEAGGHVIWSDSRVGMGIQFEQVSSVDQRSLETFVDNESLPMSPVR
jgi:hypothetical protein